MARSPKKTPTQVAAGKFARLAEELLKDMLAAKSQLQAAQKNAIEAAAQAARIATEANHRAAQQARKEMEQLTRSLTHIKFKDRVNRFKVAVEKAETRAKEIEAEAEVRIKAFGKKLEQKAEADYAKAVSRFEEQWKSQRTKLDLSKQVEFFRTVSKQVEASAKAATKKITELQQKQSAISTGTKAAAKPKSVASRKTKTAPKKAATASKTAVAKKLTAAKKPATTAKATPATKTATTTKKPAVAKKPAATKTATRAKPAAKKPARKTTAKTAAAKSKTTTAGKRSAPSTASKAKAKPAASQSGTKASSS